MTLEACRKIDDAVIARIAAFRESVGAGIEHDARWLRVLKEGLGHEGVVLFASDASGLRGVLPLAVVRGRLFGRFVVSLPYVNRAGVLAADEQTAHELVDAAAAIASGEDARYLELRHDAALEHAKLPQARASKVRMVLDLPGDEAALQKQVGSKVRNLLRKGDKHGLTIRWGGEELLDAFYRVFAVNMRDLGTPVYPRKLFASILKHFAGQAELAVVYGPNPSGKELPGAGVPGGAGALLIHDEVSGITQVPSASCLRSFNASAANMWMYGRLLSRAIERGARQFDFGRSSEGSGTYQFKKQWGATPAATVWQYMPRRGSVEQMRPDSGGYDALIQTWKRLPVWVTRLVGPAVVRGIP